MAATDGVLVIGADLSAISRQLAALPQMAGEEAEKAIRNIERLTARSAARISALAREQQRAATAAATAQERLRDIIAQGDPLAEANRDYEKLVARIREYGKASGDAAQQAAALAAAEKQHAARLAALSGDSDRAAQGTRSLARGLQSVAQQLPDVLGGLAMGQSPLTILTQQGPQVAEGLLASGVSAGALAAALAPLAAAAGVAAVAAGALYVAWKASNAEEARASEIAAITAQAHRDLAPLIQSTAAATERLAVLTGSLTREQAAMLAAARSAHQGYRDAAEQTISTLSRLRTEQASVGTQIADSTRGLLVAFRDLTGIEDSTIAVFDALFDSTATLTPQIEAATAAQARQIEATKANADAAKALAAEEERKRKASEASAAASKRAGEVQALLATLRRAELAALSDTARALAEATQAHADAAQQVARLGLSTDRTAAGLRALSAAVRDASQAAALADFDTLFEATPRQISHAERAAADLHATLDTLIPPAALTETERLVVAQATLAAALSRGGLSATAAAEAQQRLAAASAALAEPVRATIAQIETSTAAAVTASAQGAQQVAESVAAIPWARVIGRSMVTAIGDAVGQAQQLLGLLTGGALGGGLQQAFGAIGAAAEQGAQASAAASERIAQARRAIAEADSEEERKAAEATLARAQAEKRRAEALAADPGGAAARQMAEQALTFIGALARGVGPFVTAIADRADEIAYALAKATPIVIAELVRGAPQIAWAIVRGLGEALIEWARKLARVVRDSVKEALTGGRAETRTFGDTPGPVRVDRPTTVRVGAGDYIAASRSQDGLRSQLSMSTRSAQPIDPDALADAMADRTLTVRILGQERPARYTSGRGPVYR